MLFKGYILLNDQKSAIECGKKLLDCLSGLGLRAKEVEVIFQMAQLYQLQSKFKDAKLLYNKALKIFIETGDRNGMAICYGSLETVCQSLSEYGNAEEYQRKALAITQQIGEKHGEAACYGNLGTVCISLGEYKKAEEHLKNALDIEKEIGDKHREAACYTNLGTVSKYLGEYGKAEEYKRRALAIIQQIGDKKGEATCYGNLGAMCASLGEYKKAEEHLNNALVITKEIGNKQREATCYGSLGSVSESLGEYGKAEEYQKKALAIAEEIGDKRGVATSHLNLGTMYHFLGEYRKAEEHLNNALVITKKIGGKQGEGACYGRLGNLFRSLDKHLEAKQHHEKALAISRAISDISAEADWHLQLAYDAMSEFNEDVDNETFLNLSESINKCEKMRSFLGNNDQFKISLFEMRSPSYHLLSALFCVSGKEKEALGVLELGRARLNLADLISGHYSAQQQLSVNLPSWANIERTVKKESNSSCLFISYFGHYMFLWVLQENKPLHFRKINVNECFVTKGLERDVHQVFREDGFNRFKVLPQEHCEDRSLSFLTVCDSTHEQAEQESLAVYRLVEEEEEENLQPDPTLAEQYKMIIAPVADFVDEPELLIVPDRALYKVPFAALQDERRKYFSDAYRIRIVPSLTTLGIIQDSPADYHSRTGALIVGEPDVRDVCYKGCLGILCRLPCAREEAEMIGKLIGAEPLLGKQATKEAVLQNIGSVSLIHFAAHGDAERGKLLLLLDAQLTGLQARKITC